MNNKRIGKTVFVRISKNEINCLNRIAEKISYNILTLISSLTSRN